jgi:hypothetical protein
MLALRLAVFALKARCGSVLLPPTFPSLPVPSTRLAASPNAGIDYVPMCLTLWPDVI